MKEEAKPQKLFILDTHALLYRAFYAMEKMNLRTSNGLPTGAIYGLTQYLFNIKNTYNPSHWVAVVDPGTKSIRHEIYPEYKKNRSAMPSDLVKQLPYIEQLMAFFGICYVKIPGVEADDVIASIVTRHSLRIDCMIVSKDKDLMQLLNSSVSMLSPNGSGRFDVIKPAEVVMKFGVYPQQLKYFLAMVGDSSDNIPGIRGIGPKRAATMIHANNIPDTPELKLSLDLVKLRPDAAHTFSLESYEYRGITPLLKNFFTALEFKSFLTEVV